MERKDLLGINGKIFTSQGKAIQENAAADIRVLVVGNPCNTNCLIAMENCRDVPRDRWFAMTRLDENRAKSQLAAKAGVPVGSVSNLAIWGNHSATQYPDFQHARIDGKPVPEMIPDEAWLRGTFISTVAVHSDGSYGVEPGLVSSFPIRSNGQRWEIVQGLDIDEFSRERIDRSVAELKEEKGLVADLIKG